MWRFFKPRNFSKVLESWKVWKVAEGAAENLPNELFEAKRSKRTKIPFAGKKNERQATFLATFESISRDFQANLESISLFPQQKRFRFGQRFYLLEWQTSSPF